MSSADVPELAAATLVAPGAHVDSATVGRKIPWALCVGCALIVLVAAFGKYLPLRNPLTTSLADQFKPPLGFGGSRAHPLGTDDLGRDVLSRLVNGAQTSLLVVVGSIVMGGGIGTALGMIAGYRRGVIDALTMRIVDATLAFPVLLAALVAATVFGPGIRMVIIVLSFAVSVRYTRLVRGEVLAARERDYVTSARVAGASATRILVRHILPNIAGTIVVFATLQVGWAIMMEATLSFFGAGLPPDVPSWGSMISEGRQYISTAWWVSVVPGLAIIVVVLAFNALGDWLRDFIDPETHR